MNWAVRERDFLCCLSMHLESQQLGEQLCPGREDSGQCQEQVGEVRGSLHVASGRPKADPSFRPKRGFSGHTRQTSNVYLKCEGHLLCSRPGPHLATSGGSAHVRKGLWSLFSSSNN